MEKLYSLKTAAEMLDISIRTLRRIIENEDIEVYQVGTRLRLSESQIKSMIKPQKSAKTVVDELLND
ncbi:helix-turn-helix domain-containing protein [candidate division KSB1 bacterium]|nr:helix-turn-helix domain-containing protein [candidate division KSB1 bacterium]